MIINLPEVYINTLTMSVAYAYEQVEFIALQGQYLIKRKFLSFQPGCTNGRVSLVLFSSIHTGLQSYSLTYLLKNYETRAGFFSSLCT